MTEFLGYNVTRPDPGAVDEYSPYGFKSRPVARTDPGGNGRY